MYRNEADHKESFMLRFAVEDMSCGHCVKAITAALLALDPKAQVQIDLSAKQVAVDTRAGAGPVGAAITAAGYTPKPVATVATVASLREPASAKGCCSRG